MDFQPYQWQTTLPSVLSSVLPSASILARAICSVVAGHGERFLGYLLKIEITHAPQLAPPLVSLVDCSSSGTAADSARMGCIGALRFIRVSPLPRLPCFVCCRIRIIQSCVSALVRDSKAANDQRVCLMVTPVQCS
jgi:hypothetical protein